MEIFKILNPSPSNPEYTKKLLGLFYQSMLLHDTTV